MTVVITLLFLARFEKAKVYSFEPDDPIRIVDSSNNEILDNKLWNDPANIHPFNTIPRNIVEMGGLR